MKFIANFLKMIAAAAGIIGFSWVAGGFLYRFNSQSEGLVRAFLRLLLGMLVLEILSFLFCTILIAVSRFKNGKEK